MLIGVVIIMAFVSFILLKKVARDGLKFGGNALDVELTKMKRRNKSSDEKLILQQINVLSVSGNIQKIFNEQKKDIDKNKSVSEILMELGVECSEGDIESFTYEGVIPTIVGAVQKGKNLCAIAEYTYHIYSTLREQVEFK